LTRQWHSFRGTEADGLFDPQEGFVPRSQVLQELEGKSLSEQKQIRRRYRRAVVWTDIKGQPRGYSPEWLPEDKGVARVVEVREEVPEEELETAYVQAEQVLQAESTGQTAEERIAELEQKLKAVTELALKLAQKD